MLCPQKADSDLKAQDIELTASQLDRANAIPQVTSLLCRPEKPELRSLPGVLLAKLAVNLASAAKLI